MLNNIIDILPVSLLVLLLCGMKIEKPPTSLNTAGYLSLETGNCLRGFFALVVLFHHLAQYTESGIAFRYFIKIGFLAVAFFFFISGYGLQKSFIKKQDSYRKGFLLRRIPTVLVPYIVITFFYWLMYKRNGLVYSFKDIVFSIADGHPIAANSWYLINIFVFYIVFKLLMFIGKKHSFLMILGSTVWYFLYAFFCYKRGYGSWWYKSSHLLTVGMFWAAYEDKILAILKKYYFIITPVTWIAFGTLFAFLTKTPEPVPAMILSLFAAMFFVLSVVLFSLKFCIGNKVLGFLGNISLEIYISQGLMITTLINGKIHIESELLRCIAVSAATVLFAYLLHLVLSAVIGKYKLLLRKLNV